MFVRGYNPGWFDTLDANVRRSIGPMTTENNVILITWQIPLSSKAPEAFGLLTELGGTDAIDLHQAALIERNDEGVFVLTDPDGNSVSFDEGPVRELLSALDGPHSGAIADPSSVPGVDRPGAYTPKDWKSLTEVITRLAPGRAGVIAHAEVVSREPIDKIIENTGASVMRIHEHELLREINAVGAAVEESAAPPPEPEHHESLADRAHGLVDKIKDKLH